jgi:hypothetical protein
MSTTAARDAWLDWKIELRQNDFNPAQLDEIRAGLQVAWDDAGVEANNFKKSIGTALPKFISAQVQRQAAAVPEQDTTALLASDEYDYEEKDESTKLALEQGIKDIEAENTASTALRAEAEPLIDLIKTWSGHPLEWTMKRLHADQLSLLKGINRNMKIYRSFAAIWKH